MKSLIDFNKITVTHHSVCLESPDLFNRPLTLLHLSFKVATFARAMNQELATE